MALKLLVDVYRFRDAVHAARNPMFSLEGLNFGGASLPQDERYKMHMIMEANLRARHDRVAEIRSQLEVAAFACEAAWDSLLQQPLKNLFMVYQDLKLDADRFIVLNNPAITDEGKRVYLMFHGERTNIAFNDRSASSNDFLSRLESTISALKSILKSKMAN